MAAVVVLADAAGDVGVVEDAGDIVAGMVVECQTSRSLRDRELQTSISSWCC